MCAVWYDSLKIFDLLNYLTSNFVIPFLGMFELILVIESENVVNVAIILDLLKNASCISLSKYNKNSSIFVIIAKITRGFFLTYY